jgi:hypothetical protein
MAQRHVAERELNLFVDEQGLESPNAIPNLESGASDQVSVDIKIRDELRARLAFKAQEPIPERLRIENIRNLRRLRSRTGSA